MNDEELGQRLHDELRSRIDPPASAPESLREHVRNLRSMQAVRQGGPGNGAHSFRNLFAVAAAIAAVALLTAGLFAWQPLKPRTGAVSPTKGIEMFGRVDSKTAWAESGSDLYITRDGGVTWSHGTLPGGRSMGEINDYMMAAQSVQPAPIEATPTPGPASDQASPYTNFPNHLYPSFIDADHGWLLSWTVPTTSTGDWTLTVHRTSDGGRTWASTQLPGAYKGYGLVQFTDAQHGWVTVYRLDYAMANSGTAGGPEPTPTPTPAPPSNATTVLATSDGGATWAPISTIPALALVDFTSVTEAWGYTQGAGASGPDSMVHSIDGGHTWQMATLPIPAGYMSMGTADAPTRTSESSLTVRVQCTTSGSESSGYAIVTFVSGDDGQTWTVASTSTLDSGFMSAGMSAVLQLPPGQPIVAYGATFTDAGSTPAMPIKASFDGGKTWMEYQTAGLPSDVSMAQWALPDDVWVMVASNGSSSALGGQLYATHDQGRTWTALLGAPAWPASPAPVPTPIFLQTAEAVAQALPTIASVGRVDARVGWVVVSQPDGSNDLRFTQDGGATWTDPRSMPSGGDVQFLDADHGWILNSEMMGGSTNTFSVVVLRTADGGRTWEKPAGTDLGTIQGDSQKTYALASMHFRDALHGELFVSLGSSSDGPAAERSASPAGAPVCEQLSTSDGGATWSQPKSAPCMMNTSFTDATLGYGSDLQGAPVIHLTVDGGQTWIDANLPLPAGTSGVGSSGTLAQLLERRADGTLRALVSSMISVPTVTTVVVSSDGGKTWTAAGDAQGLNGPAYSVASLGEGHWLALGQNFSSGTTPFTLDARVSEDGGVTWRSIAAQGLPPYTTAPHFVGATDGWVTAADPTCDGSSTDKTGCSLGIWSVYGTTDGGSTWQPIFTP